MPLLSLQIFRLTLTEPETRRLKALEILNSGSGQEEVHIKISFRWRSGLSQAQAQDNIRLRPRSGLGQNQVRLRSRLG